MPISIGDIIYVCWGIGIIAGVIKLVQNLLRPVKNTDKLLYGFLKWVSAIASLYFFFLIGWGGNYYKGPLEEHWQLDRKRWTDSSIIAYDRYLIQRLNELAPHYKPGSFSYTVDKAKDYYEKHTDCFYRAKGLHVKPSIFGNLLHYISVQGYYNPFTGEGQVNDKQPAFMFPFVVAHEMAHQAGIGAEDDANLLAYAVSVSSEDTAFLYSAYFNIWLYTHSQLRMMDTTVASNLKKELNLLTTAQLDTLRQLRRKYRGKFSNYTGDMYDQYLRMNNQKDGIYSYDKVAISAWLWEQKRREGVIRKIYIP